MAEIQPRLSEYPGLYPLVAALHVFYCMAYLSPGAMFSQIHKTVRVDHSCALEMLTGDTTIASKRWRSNASFAGPRVFPGG